MTLTLGLQAIFFASAVLIVYVYLGYPLFVYVIGRISSRRAVRATIEPAVSIIITAYNEERDMRRKLENTLRLDYPANKLEIIVASDCSSDRTDDIVREFSDNRVKLVRQHERQGKTAAQNIAVENASGEIIVFSDATSNYEPNVLREILPAFADETIGCVAGKLTYVDHSGSTVGKAAKSYWSYETFLKESESNACSLVGVSGCLYAVRRSAYRPMYPEACSDFLIATIIYRQGMRTVYEPNAVCTEETNQQSKKEMRMRVRVISQTFTDLWRNRDMLNPFRSGFFALQLISHKLLRYSVPLFLIALVTTSGILALDSFFYLAVLLAQLTFYFVATAAWVLEKQEIRVGPFAIPLYFVLANVASAVGFFQFLRGERYASWEPIRDAG
jgi:cellulose synthase/poly-beta-1,6-N-acetylglucosamine synthase-like glycosyltransferase